MQILFELVALYWSVFLTLTFVLNLGFVRTTAFKVILLILQLNSIILQLKTLRLRMDQELQRSLIWLVRSHNFVPGLVRNLIFFPQSTHSDLYLFKDMSIIVLRQSWKPWMLQFQVTTWGNPYIKPRGGQNVLKFTLTRWTGSSSLWASGLWISYWFRTQRRSRWICFPQMLFQYCW